MESNLVRLRAAEALLGPQGWPQASGNDTVVEVYLSLLQQVTPSRAALISDGFAPDVIDYALLLLHDRGVIDTTNPSAISIHPPDQALKAYATALETFAITARSAIEPLTQLYRQTHAPESELNLTNLVSFVPSVEELLNARNAAVSRARKSIVRLIARGSLGDSIVHGNHPSVSLVTEGLQIPRRTVMVDASFLEEEGALDALSQIEQAGSAVRLVPRIRLSSTVIDGELAFIEITHIDPVGYGGVIIQHRPLVQVFSDVLTVSWERGTTLPSSKTVARVGTDPKDLQILAMLAAGASDSTIARQLRVSQRTVERRLRAIMGSFGVETRFQLGIAVKSAGLV